MGAQLPLKVAQMAFSSYDGSFGERQACQKSDNIPMVPQSLDIRRLAMIFNDRWWRYLCLSSFRPETSRLLYEHSLPFLPMLHAMQIGIRKYGFFVKSHICEICMKLRFGTNVSHLYHYPHQHLYALKIFLSGTAS